MPALSTDLLKKLSRKWTGQIGAAGVDDAVVTTIPLSSTTNLPADTAVVISIDRVDANGIKTPTLEESVIGVVSGSNLVSCVRGAEGTAQAHAAGAVVEVLITAKGYNDIIDHLLVEHSQLGVHTSAMVTSLKATGAVVNTGTSDVTIVTPKALADSYIASLPTATSTTTFTNKRIEPRIVTAASYTTDTGTSLSVATADIFQVTAQAGALKFNNPGGTPVAGQKLIVRIKDDGTASALTYDTEFRAIDISLPTTTVLGKTLYMEFIRNHTDTKWDLIKLNQEAGMPWTTYVPTFGGFTKGSATVYSNYTQIGKVVHYWGAVILAADSSVSAAITISLPVTAIGANYYSWDCTLFDASTWQKGTLLQTANDTVTLYAIKTDGAYLTLAETSATIPFTWTTNHRFVWDITYEAA